MQNKSNFCENCQSKTIKIKSFYLKLPINKEQTKSKLFDLQYSYCEKCKMLINVKDISAKCF